MSDGAIIEQLGKLVGVLEQQAEGPNKRVFETYCGSLRAPAEAARYVQFVHHLVDLSGVDLPRARVLEAGCGYGFLCVTLACLGAREVHGIELAPHKLVDIRRYRPFLPAGLPLQFHQADVSHLPFADGSIDFLLVVEAISHFAEVDRFLDDAQRVLAPGGRLLISDGNNGANPIVRRRTEKYWAQLELGEDGPQKGAHEALRKPFVDARDALLQEELGLPAAAARDLAQRTSGLRRAEILAAGRRYLDSGEKPAHFYQRGTCPMDPVNLQYEEMLFDPHELGARLARRGFCCRVLPHFGGESRGGWVLQVNRAIQRLPSRWTTPFARGFRLVAVKR